MNSDKSRQKSMGQKVQVESKTSAASSGQRHVIFSQNSQRDLLQNSNDQDQKAAANIPVNSQNQISGGYFQKENQEESEKNNENNQLKDNSSKATLKENTEGQRNGDDKYFSEKPLSLDFRVDKESSYVKSKRVLIEQQSKSSQPGKTQCASGKSQVRISERTQRVVTDTSVVNQGSDANTGRSEAPLLSNSIYATKRYFAVPNLNINQASQQSSSAKKQSNLKVQIETPGYALLSPSNISLNDQHFTGNQGLVFSNSCVSPQFIHNVNNLKIQRVFSAMPGHRNMKRVTTQRGARKSMKNEPIQISQTVKQGSSLFESVAQSAKLNQQQIMSARIQSEKDLAARIQLRSKLVGTSHMMEDLRQIRGSGKIQAIREQAPQTSRPTTANEQASQNNQYQPYKTLNNFNEIRMFDHSQKQTSDAYMVQNQSENSVLKSADNNLVAPNHELYMQTLRGSVNDNLTSKPLLVNKSNTKFVISGQEKEIRAADRSDIVGYTLISPNSTNDNNVKFVNQNTRQSYTQLTNKLNSSRNTKPGGRSWQIPQDLYAEMLLEHQFNKQKKTEERDIALGRREEDYSISKTSRRQQLTVFKQSQMVHEIYEEDPAATQKHIGNNQQLDSEEKETKIEDLLDQDALGEDPTTTGQAKLITDLMGKQLMGFEKENLNIQSSLLLYKQSLTSDEKVKFHKRISEVQNELIENLFMFDENLKLKLQMNLDLIQQDYQIWQTHQKHFQQQLKQDLRKDEISKLTDAQLEAPFFKNCNQQLKNQVEKLQKIVARLKLQPFHHNLEPIKNRDDMLKNLNQVKEQHVQQNEDLKFVTDCFRLMMQQKSMSWLNHQGKDSKGGSEQAPLRKDKKVVKKVSSMGWSQSNQAQSPAVETQEDQRSKEQELYDQFQCNQVIQLSSMYMLSVIDKYMEMQYVAQDRQKVLLQNIIRQYKEEVQFNFDNMQKINSMALERQDLKISRLSKQLADSRKEQERLKNVINGKDDEIKLLLAGGDDVRQMKRMYYQFDQALDQIEQSGGAQQANLTMMKGLQKTIDKEQEKRKMESQKEDLSLQKKKSEPRLRKKSTLRKQSSIEPPVKSDSENRREAIRQANREEQREKDKYLAEQEKYIRQLEKDLKKKNKLEEQSVGQTSDESPLIRQRQTNLEIMQSEQFYCARCGKETKLQTDSSAQSLLTPSPGISKLSKKLNPTVKTQFTELTVIQQQSPKTSLKSSKAKKDKKISAKDQSPGKTDQVKKSKSNVKQTTGNQEDMKSDQLSQNSSIVENASDKDSVGSSQEFSQSESELRKNQDLSSPVGSIGKKQRSSKKSKVNQSAVKKTKVVKREPEEKLISKQETQETLDIPVISQANQLSRTDNVMDFQNDKAMVTITASQVGENEGVTQQNMHVKLNIQPKDDGPVSDRKDSQKGKKHQEIQPIDFSKLQESKSGLPDSAVIRLIEIAMEEIAICQANQSLNHGAVLPSNQPVHFKQKLMKFLLTQYGLPKMAENYFNHICLRVYQYAQSDQNNKYAQIILDILNQRMQDGFGGEIVIQASNDPKFNLNWHCQIEQVAINAIILFQDARAVSQGASNKIMESMQPVSPRKKIQISNIKSVKDIMSKGGDEVCIFELNDLICKYHPLNSLSFKITERLQPAQLDFTPAPNLEEAFLKFSQMKVTSKLSKLFFDDKLFFTHFKTKSAHVSFQQLLLTLADKLQLYFSAPEQIAMRNALLPQYRGESIEFSRGRQVCLVKFGKSSQNNQNGGIQEEKSFDEVMFLEADEFFRSIPDYMVRKSDFVEFVIGVWKEFMGEMSVKVTKLFMEYDQYFQRGALNQVQFEKIVVEELRFNYKYSFGRSFKRKNIQTLSYLSQDEKDQIWQMAVKEVEQKRILKEFEILSLASVREMVLERNHEVVPFSRYIHSKYQMKQVANTMDF